MKFQKYTKYKASGVDWLGEIPEEWEVRRLKDLVLSNQKSLSNNEKPDLLIKYIDISNVETDKLKNEPEKLYFIDAPSRARRIPKKNDLIISTVRTYLKAIYFFENIDNNIICSTGFSVLTPKNIIPVFLKYISISEKFINNIIKYSKGVSYPAINDSELMSLLVFLSPKQTQTKIANYLDEKTNLIDKKISLLQQKKEKYKELKQTLINEVVTKGLDKNVKMKESEIELIGEIPEHWEVKRLKDISSIFTGNSISNKELFVNKINSYPYIATKDININTQKINYDNGIYIPKDSKDFKIAKENSILLCIEGANAGKKIAYTNRKICFVNKQCSINGYKIMFEKFLFYAIQEGTFKKHFFSFMSGLIGGVSINLIKRIPIIIPPKQEQIQVANYLDEKTKKIDDIMEKIDENIATLKEFRKTLINDAVTGKIKVA